MAPLSPSEGRRPRRFALWAVGPWVLLLLAAFGAVQYLQHAHFASLIVALAVIGVCAGCILRQAWARPAMQVLALLLAAWAAVTGVLMLRQWGDFELARQQLGGGSELGDMAVWMIDRAERTWRVALALKWLAVAPLLWLGWQMSRPAVREQFRARRPRTGP